MYTHLLGGGDTSNKKEDILNKYTLEERLEIGRQMYYHFVLPSFPKVQKNM